MTTVYVMVENYSDGVSCWNTSIPEHPIFSSMEKLRKWFLDNFFDLDLKQHDGYEFYFYAIGVDSENRENRIIIDSVIPGYEHPQWFIGEFDENGDRIDWEKVS